MKKLIALLCIAFFASAASAAETVHDNASYCAQLSSDIAARSALFSAVVRAEPGSTGIAPSALPASRGRALDSTVALQDIANEIWSLRTRMAYLDCAQVKTFAY